MHMHSERPKILYIASLSHSGSTLLDLMLGAHPEGVSVGELKQLGRYARFQKPKHKLRCSCGADTLLRCEFWNQVNSLTQESIGVTLDMLNVETYEHPANFHRDNAALFNAIASVSSSRFIVDSSKSPYRLALLLQDPKLDLFPIFLLRDPRGQICSSIRKEGRLGRLIVTNVRINREIYALVRHRPHAVVHYEALVREPRQTLADLMSAVGLSFDLAQLDWAAPSRHNVAGNRMRRGTSSNLKLDEKWRRQLTPMQKLAISIGTMPGRFPYMEWA